MHQIETKLKLGLFTILFVFLFRIVVGNAPETWYEYKSRTDKERSSRSKRSAEMDKGLEEIHSRHKRGIGFPTGSTFSITPVLCIPVVSLGDLTGALDIELPFTIKLPNGTQVTNNFGRRNNDDRLGIYSVIIDALNRFGLNGKICLMRAICEIAEAPLKHDGLMGEIINIALGVPPTTPDTDMRDYIEAGHNGRAYGTCPSLYPDCPISIFKLIEG